LKEIGGAAPHGGLRRAGVACLRMRRPTLLQTIAGVPVRDLARVDACWSLGAMGLSDYIYGAVADSTGVYVVGNLGVVSPQTFPSGQPFLTK